MCLEKVAGRERLPAVYGCEGTTTLELSICEDALVHPDVDGAGDATYMCRDIAADILGKRLLRHDLQEGAGSAW
jgi:hypothetical protein